VTEFNSYEEAMKTVKTEFRRIFGKGWKLVANSSNSHYKKV
jgi:superoxide dismutase